MNVMIISDDYYFSSGLLNSLQNVGVQCDICKQVDFDPIRISAMSDYYDLMMLDLSLMQNVNHIFMTRRMLSKWLFVVDICPTFLNGNFRIVSRRSSPIDLIYKLKQFMNVKSPQIKETELEALRLYNAGCDMSSISSQLNVTQKSAYRLRYDLVRKLGFSRYHPVTVIYCEKIAALS